ncbi:ABC transporter permease [Actinophytocola sp.]|uniref:ABC transporter permease n=1 Tax=Actinophytocola sp. TaxID=1872138 RepID=UPI003D6A6D9D
MTRPSGVSGDVHDNSPADSPAGEPNGTAAETTRPAGDEAPAAPPVRRRKRHRLLLLWQALVLVVIVGGWQLAIVVFDISPVVLASPVDVWNSLVSGFTQPIDSPGAWYGSILETLQEAMGGLAVGSVAGVLVAALLAEFAGAWAVLAPYIVAMQVTPKVAIAPLFLLLLGPGYLPKFTIVALLTFFPMLVNARSGFQIVPAERLDIVRALGGTRWQVFWHVKLRSGLPMIFAGLNVAVVFSLTGAVVGEFATGGDGLGGRVQIYTTVFDQAGVFAALVLLTMIGVTLFLIVRVIERRLLFWAEERSTDVVGA